MPKIPSVELDILLEEDLELEQVKQEEKFSNFEKTRKPKLKKFRKDIWE